jgi:hypothetical protein
MELQVRIEAVASVAFWKKTEIIHAVIFSIHVMPS